MSSFHQDVRFALRGLRRAPGFTATVVLTLALGIGATAAMFTLVYDVMLRPLPYPRPDRIVVMEEQVAEFRDLYPELPMSANHFEFWRRNSRTVAAMAAMRERSMPLGAGEHPLQAEVLQTTPGIFSVLEATPQLGRGFAPAEAQEGHDRVAILMNGLWRTQFGGDPRILGRTVTLNGFPYTVIGVMPRSFHLPVVDMIVTPASQRAKAVQVLVPLVFSKDELQERVGDFNYFVLGRLKPGVSAAAASSELNGLQHTLTASLSAQEKATLSAVIVPFQQALVGDNRKALLILLAAVAGLLLVACVNVANLLLVRAAGRRQQMAVAAALGATRGEMLRCALRETAVLAALGGVLGIGLAAVLLPLMQLYLPPSLDFRGALHLDWAGAACALLIAVAATLIAGAVPGWIGSRAQPREVLHSESRLATESRPRKRLRRTLVAAEVAVSVVLLLLTGLVTASLMRLMRVDRGFDAERTLTATVALPNRAYSDQNPRAAFYRQVLDRLNQLPGVDHAALISKPPLGGDQWIDMIRANGDARPFMQLPAQHFRWISTGYFATIHLPLVAGRDLSPSDQGKRYALVSELTARTLWPHQDAVGRQFTRGGSDEPPFTVIGVVRDARTVSLAAPDPMMVYVPYWYRCDNSGTILVRTRQDPASVADAVRHAIWSVNPDVSVPVVRTLGGVVADSVANRRFEMDLLLLFAATSLLLAGLGVYGVVAYSVAQRQREIGLRMALGAQRTNIYGLVLRDGLAPVAFGAVAGIAIGFASARAIASLLFQTSPYNPAVIACATLLLGMVGAAACLIPARQAAAVEPMQALRTE
jgi:predicted permease